MSDVADPLSDFLRAACVPREGDHASATLEQARRILAAHPEVAGASLHAAAVLGDEATVRRFLAEDPASVTAQGGPHAWDALTHLCFSRYLRLERERSPAFVRSARALLDAGADPNSGWFDETHEPEPTFESVLYGAAGIAHDPELTRLLLERGADPNDGEVPYHAPEWFDNRAMEAIVESGTLAPDGLTTMLHRKLDWMDYEGVPWLLAHGADPNRLSRWGRRALGHALQRDNPVSFVELLLDYDADPTLPCAVGASAIQQAARQGRADALGAFQRRGFNTTLQGDDAFLAACACGDEASARDIATVAPDLVPRLRLQDPAALARFAGAGNTAGVRILLDFGFDPAAPAGRPGEPGGTALHLAVWRERPDTVQLLVLRGAPLEAINASDSTPLALAVRAQLHPSEFTPHESLDILEMLLAAGAHVDAVKPFPTGHAGADALLRRFGAA